MPLIGIKEGYEKTACLPCKGTGRVPKSGAGYYTWKSDRRRKPSCSACGGYGFTVSKKKLPETPIIGGRR